MVCCAGQILPSHRAGVRPAVCSGDGGAGFLGAWAQVLPWGMMRVFLPPPAAGEWPLYVPTTDKSTTHVINVLFR